MANNPFAVLLNVPERQATRMQIVMRAVSMEDWVTARYFLRHAIEEEAGTPWASVAHELMFACQLKESAREWVKKMGGV